MKVYLLLIYFFFSLNVHGVDLWNKSWIIKDNQKLSLENLINILKRSQSGNLIIEKAKSKYQKNIITFLTLGEISITDTSLRRSFYPGSSKVTYEEHSKITINKYLNTKDAVLDLAHELTHFTFRKVFNPYLHNYSIREYVNRTIEGKGGEVDAFLTECKVRSELFGKKSLFENQCGSIINNNTLSRRKTIKLFYQMGEYYSRFIEIADQENFEYSLLSSKNHRFISSAYNVPYPLAAALEYKSINNKICKTNNMRIISFKKEMRKPASQSKRAPASSVLLSLESQYRRRCL